MLSDRVYRRLRFRYFRMHYQFVMGNELRAPYDYFLLVCGPAPLADWAKRSDEVFHAFAADATFAEAGITLPALN